MASMANTAPQLSAAEEAAGRACYDAFAAAMAPWLPYPADWAAQAATVKRAWAAAANAARSLAP